MQKATVLILAILLSLPLSTAQDDEGSQENAAQRDVDITTLAPCGGTGDPCNEPAGQLCCSLLKCVSSHCCPTTDGC
uniref:Conotoxin n=1 Tax=Conus betulinus TaxID=89764 RepID=A0A142C1Q0_CONBE|nr:conotoxin [Conus betulinus]